MSHPASHGPLLERLLAGAEDPRAALERSPLAGCTECLNQLEELMATAEHVDQVYEDQREEFKALGSEGPAPGEDAAIHRLGEVIARERRRLWRLPAAAAALFLVGLFVWRLASEPGPGYDPDVLLGGPLRVVAPEGHVARHSEFTWSGDLPDGHYFIVRVYDARELDRTLVESEPLRTWKWTPEATDSFPAEIYWTVELYSEANVREPLELASGLSSR